MGPSGSEERRAKTTASLWFDRKKKNIESPLNEIIPQQRQREMVEDSQSAALPSRFISTQTVFSRSTQVTDICVPVQLSLITFHFLTHLSVPLHLVTNFGVNTTIFYNEEHLDQLETSLLIRFLGLRFILKIKWHVVILVKKNYFISNELLVIYNSETLCACTFLYLMFGAKLSLGLCCVHVNCFSDGHKKLVVWSCIRRPNPTSHQCCHCLKQESSHKLQQKVKLGR